MLIVLDNVAQSSISMHSMHFHTPEIPILSSGFGENGSIGRWPDCVVGCWVVEWEWRVSREELEACEVLQWRVDGKEDEDDTSSSGDDQKGQFVHNYVIANIKCVFVQLRNLEMEKRDPRTVVAVILGGGAGTRLFPLTKRCAKPAVPIGGGYRLIDVPMSNCINSGINKVYILTQFNSASLNRHLGRAYSLGGGVTFGDGFVEALAATQTQGETGKRWFQGTADVVRQFHWLFEFNSASLNRHLGRAYSLGGGVTFGDGFVEALAATQTQGETGKRWFQGTADAVRQFHWLFEDARSKDIEDVLILSGDHLYRMDYMDFVHNHRQSGANITLSCLPMDNSRASDFGLMKMDGKGRIISFSEKPKGVDLKAMAVDTTVIRLSREEDEKKPYIASMGVYVFKKEILLNLSRWRFPTTNDFGSEIIPASAKEFFIKAYLFNDYWEDIGTKSFFEANLALTAHPPRSSFYDANNPMYTSRRNLPPSKIDSSKDTVMLGADYYETDAEVAALVAEGRVPIGIGENTKIKNCIIDKNARIGKNVVMANSEFWHHESISHRMQLLATNKSKS
ncbi:hypothetical protein TEA_014304 [Camellia sinensis var. sinensis]|uniref:glucose-1-phosphate adenylyltransferase n=1 Tax=Camellia sinensis var. sinensis TaxID=542762 RepID=A0A4S4EDL0_CAMSN|nr:hypothetical protein TEA_014304 [Camellia sinensis var. sinensis]